MIIHFDRIPFYLTKNELVISVEFEAAFEGRLYIFEK